MIRSTQQIALPFYDYNCTIEITLKKRLLKTFYPILFSLLNTNGKFPMFKYNQLYEF